VLGFDLESQKYKLQDIFARKYEGFDDEGKIISELIPTGILPECIHQLEEHGVALPDPVLAEARAREKRA